MASLSSLSIPSCPDLDIPTERRMSGQDAQETVSGQHSTRRSLADHFIPEMIYDMSSGTSVPVCHCWAYSCAAVTFDEHDKPINHGSLYSIIRF